MASAKIKTLKRLKTLRSLWSWEGRTVVFTNGVFDILHAGHVELLQKARALGDILIVALNSDASSRRLAKAWPPRPINRFADRAAVIAALGCVDGVIRFEEDTPESLVKALRPDILVKGADYKKGQIAGARYAGKVVRVALKKGYSTTGLLARLAKKK